MVVCDRTTDYSVVTCCGISKAGIYVACILGIILDGTNSYRVLIEAEHTVDEVVIDNCVVLNECTLLVVEVFLIKLYCVVIRAFLTPDIVIRTSFLGKKCEILITEFTV